MRKFEKGKISYTRFTVKDTEPWDIAEIRKAVTKQAFRPLLSDELREESVGWVDPFLSFDSTGFNNILFNEYVLLTMRIDRYTFGGAQIMPYLEEAEYNFKKENNLEFLPAQTKKEIKETVVRKLREKTLPKITFAEITWNSSEGFLYLFSQSRHVVALFCDLFEKTFGITIEPTLITDQAAAIQGEAIEPVLGRIWGK